MLWMLMEMTMVRQIMTLMMLLMTLMILALRACRRVLTSTSVRLFLGPNRTVISRTTAIHRCASGANASFAPGQHM